MNDIQQRINRSAFNDALKSRNKTQMIVATNLGINEKSFSRWINEGQIQSRYLLDLSEELDLSDKELQDILMLPKYKVFFRKKFLSEVPPEIGERAIELATTLFGMTFLNSESRFCPPNASKIDSANEVANQIRRYTKIESYKNLQGIITSLAEQGVEVAVVPFSKLGLKSEGDYESAFSVTDEKRCLIFLDSDSPEELLIFNLCHELCHLFRPDLEFSKIEEKFCNAVASELVYPESFFNTHKEKIQNIIDSQSAESIVNLMKVINENLGGEIYGIAVRLKNLGFFSQKNPQHQKMINFAMFSFKKLPKIEVEVFYDFWPQNKTQFISFWDSEELERNSLLRFFFLIKTSAISGSISPRKFSELFGTSVGLSDELFHNWKHSLKLSMEQNE